MAQQLLYKTCLLCGDPGLMTSFNMKLGVGALCSEPLQASRWVVPGRMAREPPGHLPNIWASAKPIKAISRDGKGQRAKRAVKMLCLPYVSISTIMKTKQLFFFITRSVCALKYFLCCQTTISPHHKSN